MSGAANRVWLLLAAMATGDAIMCVADGIAVSNWTPFCAVGAALLLIAAIGNRWDGLGRRAASVAEWILLWLAYAIAGALLTYLAAVHGGPPYDASLAAGDRTLGFDWTRWFDFVGAHPLLKLPLALAYASLAPQILLSVLVFSSPGNSARNAEMLTGAIIGLVLTAAIFSLFPTYGPAAGLPVLHEAYVEDLVALRHGALPSLDIMLLKGVVAFPSFHAVLAVLFINAHRGSRLFLPIAALNLLMLAALPSEGGHYLLDVPAGIVVGILALLTARLWSARAPVFAPAGGD